LLTERIPFLDIWLHPISGYLAALIQLSSCALKDDAQQAVPLLLIGREVLQSNALANLHGPRY
jgi:hypothetical protein